MCAMTYELSREHEEFRRVVREFAEGEIAPHAAQWDRDHHFPIDVVQQMGKLGLMGLTAPEEYGGAGEDGDFTSLCVAIEEIGRVDQSMGITLEAAVGLGINPILTYGSAEQKEQWLPDLVAGPGPGRLRPHRARCRLGRRRHAHAGRADRRRVGRQRRQAVHHQLRAPTSPRASPSRPAPGRRPRGSPRSRRSSCRRTRPGSPRSRRTTSSAGTPPTPTRSRCDDVRTSRGQPARGAGPRLRAVPGHPRRRSHRDRRARGRLHPGLPRPVPAVRRGAADVRRPDRPQAGRRLPDRRPRGDAAGEPPAGLQGGGDQGRDA